MADFALVESPKLISRKIWVIEKSWNFDTVNPCHIFVCRFASISGSPDDVKLAEILIYQMIANQPKLEQMDIFVRAIYIGKTGFTKAVQCTRSRFLLVKWILILSFHIIGRIIGRNGEVIRSIQDRSRCKIKVERGQTYDGKWFILQFSL